MLAEKARLIQRPARDSKHVLLLQCLGEAVQLRERRSRVRRVGTVERGTSPSEDAIGALPQGRDPRFRRNRPEDSWDKRPS
jgi:hypothetical protein